MTTHALTCPHPATEAPPLLGEPLALEFVNTHYAVRGSLRDGLGRPDYLAWWLSMCRDRFSTELTDAALAAVDEADVVHFRELRDASRRLIDVRVEGGEPDSRDVAQVNRAGGLGRSWPILLWNPQQPPTVARLGAQGPLLEAQAELAHAVVTLLTAPQADVAACPGPGCVLFFERNPPRRAWCSPGCGNRARAARHYHRHRPAD
ncbi:CGNR zinc finger domain-containing protein [Streptomyces sp. NPDC048718]|uniref:CGNR zinc finger domain-containing protein n=1 Tax=Streptomyces sp. NPDC048718 TaxID=3365587 RepID=UPI0037199507